MLIEIFNRVLLILFIMSCLNMVRHGYYLIQAWVASTENNPIKYRLTQKSLWVLSLSIGYVLAEIINGIYMQIN